MAKEIYNKVSQLYYKTNAELVPPVIMLEKPAIKKIVGVWVVVLRRQKGYKTIQASPRGVRQDTPALWQAALT